MSGNDSMFGSLIYRAIGEPEYWYENSVEVLVKLLTDEFSLDGPDSLAQIKLGKELVGKLSEKETLFSAVMNVLDGARYGLLMVDHKFSVIYKNKKIKPHLEHLLDSEQQGCVNKSLQRLISDAIKNFESKNAESTDLIRLDYNYDARANIYLRSTLQEGSNIGEPQYLHHLMVVDAADNDNQICQEVSDTYGLSEREASIVQSAVRALAEGGSTKEIAQDLYISPNTVKTHLKSIYAKSGVNSLAALVSLYLQHELQQLASYFGGGSPIESVVASRRDKIVTLSQGQTICYREYGDAEGRPLIVLHNSYSSRLNLPPNGDAVAKKVGRRIIIPDRPGYGKSPALEDYPVRWCSYLAEFAEQLNVEKFDLLANALSVRYALEFAEKYPEKLSKLIFTTPILLTINQDDQYFCEWLRVAIQLYDSNPEFAKEIYKLWHASASLRLDNHIEKNLQTSISTSEKGLIDSSEFLMVLKNNFRESSAQEGKGTVADYRYCFNKTNMDLSQLDIHVDIWVGSEDGYHSPEGVRQTFKSLPNKVVLEKEGYGEHIYYSLFEQIIS